MPVGPAGREPWREFRAPAGPPASRPWAGGAWAKGASAAGRFGDGASAAGGPGQGDPSRRLSAAWTPKTSATEVNFRWVRNLSAPWTPKRRPLGRFQPRAQPFGALDPKTSATGAISAGCATFRRPGPQNVGRWGDAGGPRPNLAAWTEEVGLCAPREGGPSGAMSSRFRGWTSPRPSPGWLRPAPAASSTPAGAASTTPRLISRRRAS
jgi:hypothetical protein